MKKLLCKILSNKILVKKINGKNIELYYNFWGYNATAYIDNWDNLIFYEGTATSFNKFTAVRNALKNFRRITYDQRNNFDNDRI